MRASTIDINTFERSSDFYGEINLLLTVKSFDLQAIRKRYIQSRKNKSGKTGSVERRKPSLGGVISLQLNQGNIEHQEILCRTSEPRGLDLKEGRFGVASEKAVFVIEETGDSIALENPWFSYIHTVQFHPSDPNTILVSSSGFDLIQEYNFRNKEMSFEWLAWEHGFNKAKDPESGRTLILTRDTEEAKKLEAEKINFLLIQDPKTDHLPTAKRAAFINSVTYHPKNPDKLLATFFHEGKVYEIDRKSMQAVSLLDGLKNPHGGHVQWNKVIATSTGSGHIHVKEEEGILKKYSAQNIPGKPEYLQDLEWIQNTLSHQGFYIAIDSNRTSFVIIDPKNKVFDMIPYNPDWAVQDLVAGNLNNEQSRTLETLI